MTPSVEAIVKGLVAVAWADGRMAHEEHAVIDRILSAFRVEPAEATAIREYAKTPRTLEEIDVDALSAAERAQLLRHALIVVYIDGVVRSVELDLLEQLATRLQLPADEAQAVLALARERAKQLPPVR